MVKYNNNRYWSDYFDRINRIIFEFSRQFHNKLAKSFEHRYPLTTKKKKKNTKRFNVPSNSFSLSSWQSISAISCLRFVYDGIRKRRYTFPLFFYLADSMQCTRSIFKDKRNFKLQLIEISKVCPLVHRILSFFHEYISIFPPAGKIRATAGE